MGLHTVLVSSNAPSDDDKNYAAVNMALELDHGGFQDGSSLKSSVLKSDLTRRDYAESVLTTGTSSDGDDRDSGKEASGSDSVSDSNSSSSRAESPRTNQPATIAHTTVFVGPSEVVKPSCDITPTTDRSVPVPLASEGEADLTTGKTLGLVSAPVASPSVAAPPSVASPAVASPSPGNALPAAATYIPPLLSFHKSEAKKSGIRGSVSNAWTHLKRLQTVPRDLRALSRYLTLLYRMRQAKQSNRNVATAFDSTVARHPEKVAFLFEDQKWTFLQVQQYSLRVAQVFHGKVVKGDAVALLMDNRVEYICIWLGLSRLGAVPALLNCNLRLKSLSHCITSADCKMVICGTELQDALMQIRQDIADLPVYVSGAGLETQNNGNITIPGALNLDALEVVAPAIQPAEQSLVNFTDKLVYIYTSGTTGLPKAAVITHSRYQFAAIGMMCMVGVKPSDVLYGPLPLYHTAGGNLGVGCTLLDGVTLAIRKKFSVSNYFPDCRKYGCTVGQYIGEICRYLLNSPETAADKQHQVRVMFGNGLRPQIWQQFQDRFNLPRIAEFYGSTEGNANIVNMDGRVGAVGFLSVLLPFVYPCALIKIDPDTGAPVRGPDGVCVRCKPGEPGEFVGKIIANDPVRDFKGYADKKATSKKVICDVFKKGDKAFLSGDLLVMDEEGYLFFKDRTGDTFRWKGENVSTAEVENHLSGLVNSTDLAVYGVEVPNTEGRAGMAAVLDPESKIDLAAVARGVTAQLPSYARPLFLRTVKHMEITGTYKLRKTDLQKEGFDVRSIKDSVYFLDTKNTCYVPLDLDMYEKIMSGQLRV